MAEIRDLSIDIDDRPRAVLFMDLSQHGAAGSSPGGRGRTATYWVLIEWPDVPSLIPAYCHGCSVERVLSTLRLRTALRRARRSDHEQTIHADRVSTG